MSIRQYLIIAFIAIIGYGCDTTAENVLTVESPSRNNFITFFLTESGEAAYLIAHNNKTVIDTSYLSFDFKDQSSLKDGLVIESSSTGAKNETKDGAGSLRGVAISFNLK